MAGLKSIEHLLSGGGQTRRGMKILVFGPTGSGKSPLLASFPRPLMVIDCGEGGIQTYLKPPALVDGKQQVNLDRVFKGEEDLCVTVQGEDQMSQAIDFALSNEDKFNSLVIDGYNLAWEDHMDWYNDKFGGDIQGGQWRLVKGPWKARQKRLMRSRLNVGFSAWLRDIAYEQ
ncbi:MAG: AAA family ATPase, partial [Anaerolineae bacterium]|nr:AAA family ATPase [Anaerolineae bacterium]